MIINDTIIPYIFEKAMGKFILCYMHVSVMLYGKTV